LSPVSIVDVAAGFLIEERPLICGMCHRRICDIIVNRGDVLLVRAPQRKGIPEKISADRPMRWAAGPPGRKPRDPNVSIYVDNPDKGGRFRIVHEHKRNGRGPLDRTITAAKLEQMVNAAVAAGASEVVLP
jgi:hypothetical protein